MLRMRLEINPALTRRGQDSLRTLVTLTRRDMDKIAVDLDKTFRAHERRLFATEGRHGGRKWRELKEPYRTQKARRYPGRKILNRTGRLRKSLSFKSHPEHVVNVRMRPKGVDLGTEVDYAVWHALGTENMARRDPTQHKSRQLSRYNRIINDYIVERAARISRRTSRWNRTSRRFR